MTEAEVEAIVGRASKGDNSAFDQLVQSFRIPLTLYLRRFVGHREQIEDLLQETFLNAYVAIRKGRYRHINQAALAGWLRRIAWHALIHHRQPEALEGSEAPAEIPDCSGGVAQEVGNLRLFEFLNRQFDEVLIDCEGTAQGRGLGLLKKMAFLRFYVDGLSQRETVTAIMGYATRIGVLAHIDRVTVNNWIARGDILKLLVRHLVEQHRELLGKLTDPDKVCPSLEGEEKRILCMHWRLGKSAQAISEATGISSSEVEKSLRAARRKVVEGLFRVIKRELHDLRYEDDRGGV